MAEYDVEFIADDSEPDFIALSDENGHEDEFVIIGCVRHRDAYYVLAMPVSEETIAEAEEDLVYVFAVRRDGEEEYFEYITDEDVLAAVFERYEALYVEQVADDAADDGGDEE